MTKYKSRVLEISAVQWTGDNGDEVQKWVADTGGAFNHGTDGGEPWAEVYDYLGANFLPVTVNDYIILGTEQEHYPCNPEAFARKYEKVPERAVGGVIEGTDLIKDDLGTDYVIPKEQAERLGLTTGLISINNNAHKSPEELRELARVIKEEIDKATRK